jgi:hypothetical protein
MERCFCVLWQNLINLAAAEVLRLALSVEPTVESGSIVQQW